MRWFDRTNVDYKGAFAPLPFRDYLYAFSQPEYQRFRTTFDGFPVMRLVADGMVKLAEHWGGADEAVRAFSRPSRASCVLWQSMWIAIGLRFNCFTIAGIKRG